MSDTPENSTPTLTGDSSKVGIMHLLGLVNLFAWPFGLVVQAVMWAMSKDDPLMDNHGRGVMNFNISLVIYGIVGYVLTLLTAGLFIFAFIPLLIVLGVCLIIGSFVGMARAKEGKPYSYPLSLNIL